MTPAIERQNGITILIFEPDASGMEILNSAVLEELLLTLVHDAESPCVILDLSALPAFGASFLTALLLMRDQLTIRGGRLVLSGVSPFGEELLNLTRLDTVFEGFGSRCEAKCELSNTSASSYCQSEQ